jgi:hypothetical protein
MEEEVFTEMYRQAVVLNAFELLDSGNAPDEPWEWKNAYLRYDYASEVLRTELAVAGYQTIYEFFLSPDPVNEIIEAYAEQFISKEMMERAAVEYAMDKCMKLDAQDEMDLWNEFVAEYGPQTVETTAKIWAAVDTRFGVL